MTAGDVVLTGGTGLIGGRVAQRLRNAGRSVRFITRDPTRVALRGADRAFGWDGVRVEPAWLDGAAAVVHLAGEPIFGGLPTAARRERMWSSRVDSTRSLVGALGALAPDRRPRAFVCGSASGYYGDSGDDEIDEREPPGPGFLAELCRDWEAEAARARELGVRVCSLRFGVVLAREGGALALMLPIYRAGLGGPIGRGRQWFPWIHVEDCARLVELALTRDDLSGPLNCVAPGSVRNAEFNAALAKALHRPAFLALPAFAVRAGLRDVAPALLSSLRLVPAAALKAGFAFHYATLEAALAELLAPRPARGTARAAHP
jgi:hypothetical protein